MCVLGFQPAGALPLALHEPELQQDGEDLLISSSLTSSLHPHDNDVFAYLTLQQIQRVEVYFAAAIGVLMGLLGITLFQTSIIKLSEHNYDTHNFNE
jgi:hypothetical protein